MIDSICFCRNIANEKVLKFDVRRYATAINKFIGNLKTEFGAQWTKQNVNIGIQYVLEIVQ